MQGNETQANCDLGRLHIRATRLGKAYDLVFIQDPADVIIAFEDQRASDIEHVCHELAHATLLDVPLQSGLAGRISRALGNHGGLFAQENEVKTFSVVIGVLSRIGIHVDLDVMIDACMVQVQGGFSQCEVLKYWKSYESSVERECAVTIVAAQFAEAT